MDEAGWLAEQADLQEMIGFIRRRMSQRKLRLFACACCRRACGLVKFPFGPMLDQVEEYADDRLSVKDLRALHDKVGEDQRIRRGLSVPAAQAALAVTAVDLDAGWVAKHVANIFSQRALLHAILRQKTRNQKYRERSRRDAESVAEEASDMAHAAERTVQAGLLREIVGNPFRPVTVEPSWLTWMFGTVPKLAEVIYNDRSYANLPILADALEDAGCDNADILDHCRSGGEHVRGCWVLDLLLGKE
jgi:hypothetical protein